MEDYDVRYRDGGYHRDESARRGFSHRSYGADYVVTKIEKSVRTVEKSVHSAFGHKHPLKLDSMELDQNHKGVHTDEARPKFKIANWKHHDVGRKLGHKHGGKDDLEKKEPLAPPALINAGGWARPNRAMWATPPDGSANKSIGSTSESEHSIGQALQYLREEGGHTGHKDKPVVIDPPNDVREQLDHMRGTGSRNPGYRFTLAVPVRK